MTILLMCLLFLVRPVRASARTSDKPFSSKNSPFRDYVKNSIFPIKSQMNLYNEFGLPLCFEEHPAGQLAWFFCYNYFLTKDILAEGEENPAAGAGLFCFRKARRQD